MQKICRPSAYIHIGRR